MTPDERKRLAMYRRLFARLPEEIVLDMATRTFNMSDHQTCVCGWALKLAFQNGVSAEKVDVNDHLPLWDDRDALDSNCDYQAVAMARRFGGDAEGWDDLFFGALDHERLPLIERAFVDRVAALCQ